MTTKNRSRDRKKLVFRNIPACFLYTRGEKYGGAEIIWPRRQEKHIMVTDSSQSGKKGALPNGRLDDAA
jgi:hypothetical protein